MERIATLIERLQQQYVQHADAEHLIVTAQMLLNELHTLKKNTSAHKKVEVVLPGFTSPVVMPQTSAAVHTAVERKEEVQTVKTNAYMPPQVPKEIFAATPLPVEKAQPKNIMPEPAAELNEMMAKEELSLNEKLKTATTELASKLQETPLKDLRKAIGINDRFLFITELFRGDENMYDRSIKTINAFSNGAEAEYWIQRELKVKLGWEEESEAVQQFDQLVRRRFS